MLPSPSLATVCARRPAARATIGGHETVNAASWRALSKMDKEFPT